METVNNVLLCNKFGGIKRINSGFSSSVITASDMENVELFDTGINSGTGIRTMKGNSSVFEFENSDEKIINIFESVQNGEINTFIHTEDSVEGRVYLYNSISNTVTEKVNGLDITGKSSGVDFTQGWADIFVFTNGNKLVYIQLNNQDNDPDYSEVIVKEPPDVNGDKVHGLGLTVFDSRLWVFNGMKLWYSTKVNCKDFSTDNVGETTTAGDIELLKNITAIVPYLGYLIVFHRDSSCSISVDSSGNFSVSDDYMGGCAGLNAFVFQGTQLYFYDDTKKSVYSFGQSISGEKNLIDNLAQDVQEELIQLKSNKLHEIKMVSVVQADRNEFWFLLPSDNDNSIILIYDYLHGYWVKRKSQKLTTVAMIKGELYSSSKNKLLLEYSSDKFDKDEMSSFYNCTPFNLGIDNTMKILYTPPRVTLDMSYNNDFYVQYINNYDSLKKLTKKRIKTRNIKDIFYWDISYWDSSAVYKPKETNSIKRLPTSCFQTLEIKFITDNSSQGFAIRNIEFSKIKVKQL